MTTHSNLRINSILGHHADSCTESSDSVKLVILSGKNVDSGAGINPYLIYSSVINSGTNDNFERQIHDYIEQHPECSNLDFWKDPEEDEPEDT